MRQEAWETAQLGTESCGETGRAQVLHCWLRVIEWGRCFWKHTVYPEKPVADTPDSGSHRDYDTWIDFQGGGFQNVSCFTAGDDYLWGSVWGLLIEKTFTQIIVH